MTILEGINIVLGGNGLRRTTKRDSNGNSDVSEAELILDEEDLRIQGMGWHYNTYRDVTLSPDGDGFIMVPDTAIVIDSDQEDAYRNVTQQGGRLFDIDNNTFTFTGDLKVRYFRRMEFDCIPQMMAEWIAASAAVTFNERFGRGNFLPRLQRAEETARVRAQQFDADTSNLNLNDTTDAFLARGGRRRRIHGDWQ